MQKRPIEPDNFLQVTSKFREVNMEPVRESVQNTPGDRGLEKNISVSLSLCEKKDCETVKIQLSHPLRVNHEEVVICLITVEYKVLYCTC